MVFILMYNYQWDLLYIRFKNKLYYKVASSLTLITVLLYNYIEQYCFFIAFTV